MLLTCLLFSPCVTLCCLFTLLCFILARSQLLMRTCSQLKVMSVGLQMSCLVFGFNPRHTNLTLLRDGQLKAEQEMTCGQLPPNGDWELRERHNYTCTVSHLSLDNKLDVSWEPDPDRDSCSVFTFASGGDVLLAQGQNQNSPTLLKCKSAY
uniref:Ig-like domain-containing protein n=1 Tax=Oncorhynchus mykiss TaxID=8022 RepID=A0A8C7PJZ3_ONCMY